MIEQAIFASHSGPLPTPAFLRQYDEILPGLAERIVQIPEREQSHRHRIVDKALTREANLKDRGQILAFLAMIIILAFCLFLAYLGHAKEAAGVAIALVLGVVGIFVTGRVADAKAKDSDEG